MIVPDVDACETLNEISRTLASEPDLEKTAQAVTDAITRITGASLGAFVRYIPDRNGTAQRRLSVSGAPREWFEGLTVLDGLKIIRCNDILAHPENESAGTMGDFGYGATCSSR